ncbi:MAG: diguanylate cyclase/phosphodiesterase with sensor(s) [Panacagrimonas sp.]|jgi:diguanylate cyclase (GGDEF)-like protein/PAS domain S-box-containing protein|nr:EAL domain-containing protein [Panacagrimonas sp.]MCC2656168.1 diguanylate cyclase/phosphodiesterase with sensor(s) [Panacagrimonas sp.]
MADKAALGYGGLNVAAGEGSAKPSLLAGDGSRTTSQRARLLVLMAALMVVGVVSQSALINSYLLRDFARLEQSQVQASLRLIQLWLDRFVQPMESLARDVAQAVQETPDSIRSGPQAAAPLLERLRLATRLGVGYDTAAIIDGTGNILLSHSHEQGATGAERAASELELNLLRQHAAALRAGSEPALSGWNVTRGGLFGVAGAKLGSGGDVPVVVIGRSFDDAAMTALDELSGTRVTLVDAEAPPITGPGRPMQACTRLSPALNSRPQFLCVRLQDSILENGQRSSDDLRLASIAGFVVLMFGTWWFLDRSLLRRLTSLTHKLDATTPGGSTESVETAMLADGARGDELGRMSLRIGQLLGRVRKAEADMRERERSFRVLAESSGVAIFVVRDGLLYSNPFASRLTGYSRDELRERGSLVELFLEGWRERLETALARGTVDDPEGIEARGRRQNGTLYWARLHITRIDYRGGPALLVTLFDVTEQRRLEQVLADEKQNLQVILSSIHDGIVAVDHAGAVRFLNPAAERLTGIPPSLANGSALDDVVLLSEPDRNAPLDAPLLAALEASGSAGLVANVRTPQGTSRNVEISVSRSESHAGADDEGRGGSVLVMRDVSELRQLTKVLAEQASHDDLTGLINRREFSRQLHEALNGARGAPRRIALCYVDLDQFKLLNDTCGHHAGDLMLREVADALRSKVRPRDTLARLGGDEFGVLLDDCEPRQAVAIANSLRTRVSGVRFQWNGQSFSVDASIGIAMLEQVEGGVDEALALADAACYMAKDLGRNRVHLYRAADADLQQQLRHMRWATRLKDAVENSHFELYAQGIVPVAYSAPDLDACEALVRMRQPDGQVVTPDDFLAAAERYQMMNRIDQWVVASALKALQTAFAAGRRPKLFINLSGQSLGDEGFREFLLDQLTTHKNLTPQLVFEVTESAVISSLQRAKKLMEDVYSRGCAFALDDFGTGMSSFGYLKELRVDYLKIAGIFVKNVASPLDAAVCRSFTEFARMMRVTVIAEWIEDEQILRTLRDMGVDYGQGWHLGRPEPIEQVLGI